MKHFYVIQSESRLLLLSYANMIFYCVLITQPTFLITSIDISTMADISFEVRVAKQRYNFMDTQCLEVDDNTRVHIYTCHHIIIGANNTAKLFYVTDY